jgi:CHAT domain-containing protein/tetratricopeptide (TPR) repeat protein
MRLHRLSLGVLIAVLTSLVPLSFKFPVPLTVPQVLAQTPDARKVEADRLFQQGIQQYQTSQFETALQTWQQALTIYREIKDRKAEGWVLGSLGLAYKSLADYTKAIEYSQHWLGIAREIHDRQSEGKALGNLGNAYNSLADYAKAIEYYQQSLAIAKGIHDRATEGAALGNLGVAYDSLGDYAKAIEYYQQFLTMAKDIHDRQSEGNALVNLGLAYLHLGDYAKAIEYSQQLLAIAKDIHDPQSEGAALGNLGLAYLNLGDYAKAIEYSQQSLAIAKGIHDRRSEGQVLNNLGDAYIKLAGYAKAIEYYQQSLAIAKGIHNRRSEGGALGNLGVAYNYLGDYAKAIEYSQQWLAIAKGIHDRQGEGVALGNLGVAYLNLGDYAQAIDYEKQVLVIAREIHDRQGEGNALNNLGAALRQSGNLAEAEKTLIEGINVWESLRAGLRTNDANKVSIFEEQSRTYRTLQQVLIQENKTDAALEIAERGRARAFVELVARRLSPNSTEATPITPPTIEQIKQIAKTQNSTLVQYSIIYDNFKVQGKQQTHESELYIWVIKPTGVVTFRKADLNPLWQQQNTSLTELVTSSRDSIGARGRGLEIVARADAANPTPRLQQLDQLLIEPIANLLPTAPNERVIFIPQSYLFLVPFPALQDKDGKYLIEKHAILTAPSIQVLELTRKQRQRFGTNNLASQKGNNALVVGNPTMPSVPPDLGKAPQQLPPLPSAEQEAKAIAEVLHTKPLIGNLATKSAVEQLMSKARFIHLATHGLLDDVRGLGSAIALAPDSSYKEEIGKVNGLLTAEEILDLKLNAELVVLSACNTGRGKITGDGVIGLSRSLISAGVPSVLVSLWSVPDAPTAQLMTEFYQNLQKNPDKAQALRQAMLTIRKQHPNPKDWAAFTLIGEAE